MRHITSISFTGERTMRDSSNGLPCRLPRDVFAIVLLYQYNIQAGKEDSCSAKGLGCDKFLCAGVSQAFCAMRLGYRHLWESCMV